MKTVSAALLTVLLLGMTPSASAATNGQDAAQAYVVEQGIMGNASGGTFRPELSYSRVEFAIALTNYLYPQMSAESCYMALAPSLPVRYTKLFSDVMKDDIFAPQLCIGMVNGFINGNADGSFRPGSDVNVAEASKMLAQAYGLTYPSLRPIDAPWYAASMRALADRGAFANVVTPDTRLTRGMAARMFYALRNQERYPVQRIISQSGETTTRTFVEVERISRRTLLQREEEKAQAAAAQ